MNADYINAVYRGTKAILSSHLEIEVNMLKPKIEQSSVPSNEISVMLGVSGQLSGQIICSVTKETAKKIIGSMMGGLVIDEIDSMGWSAMQEFGNWVGGSTAIELSKENCIIDVTPPIVTEGETKYRSVKTFITIPLETNIGIIDIHISLKEE